MASEADLAAQVLAANGRIIDTATHPERRRKPAEIGAGRLTPPDDGGETVKARPA